MSRTESLNLPDGVSAAATAWWRRAVSADAALPGGADMTSTPEWHRALARAFLPDAGSQAKVLVAFDDTDEPAALLPLYRKRPGGRMPFGSTLALLTELYGGRTTVLAADGGPGAVPLLARLDAEYPGWSCLEATLVDGNAAAARFLDAARHCAAAIHSEPLPSSPYIELPATYDEYFKTLKANFRTEVRRGERRLRETGQLTRRLYTAPDQVDALWDAVCRIERASWKEAAGTSITRNPFQERFYREYLPLGAGAGELLAAVLFLDGRPIAHKLCLCRDATAAILKMSYVEDLKRFYPSTVLLAGYLQDIIERGVRQLDFMGTCDDFKMRWTDRTYGRTKHLIFRDSVAGRLAHARLRLARLVDAMRSGAAKAPATGEAESTT